MTTNLYEIISHECEEVKRPSRKVKVTGKVLCDFTCTITIIEPDGIGVVHEIMAEYDMKDLHYAQDFEGEEIITITSIEEKESA